MNLPEVSIILPTYNRADTLPRAIASILAQSFTDWELIVVDDGSTDNTAAIVEGIDPRIRLLRQNNGGCYVARNHGLRASRGNLITFFDSDDEWLPHYLEITTAFLAASPEDQFVMTEFWTQWGDAEFVRGIHTLIERSWDKLAREIGSQALDLAPGETDSYLRVYETREPIGAWGREIAARAGTPDAPLYRGHIFPHYRWGHLGWLPTTMLRRQALDRIGPFLEKYRTSADYRFLALLSREFRTNLISLPCAIKHEQGINGRPLAEDHLATGASQYRYSVNRLQLFDELFYIPSQADPELRQVRGHYQLFAGRKALMLGKRTEAMAHLKEACKAMPAHHAAHWLLRFVRAIPSDRAAGATYRAFLRLSELVRAIRSGKLTTAEILQKLWRRITGTARSSKAHG